MEAQTKIKCKKRVFMIICLKEKMKRGKRKNRKNRS